MLKGLRLSVTEAEAGTLVDLRNLLMILVPFALKHLGCDYSIFVYLCEGRPPKSMKFRIL